MSMSSTNRVVESDTTFLLGSSKSINQSHIHAHEAMNANTTNSTSNSSPPPTPQSDGSKLHLIGDATAAEASAGEPPCPSVSTHACLGPVTEWTEPLKACLSDDSSIEDSDHDEGDDDFYFGDVEMDAMMDTEQYLRQRSGSSGSTSASRRTSCPSLAAASSSGSSSSAGSQAASLPSDMDTSGSDGVPTTIQGFHSYSTGALSRCHASNSSLYSSRSTNSGKRKNRRRVSINNDVAVVPIPQRQEYAPAVRSRLWTSGQELYQNAARNTVEFASEGWNWRSVTEDENMLRHTISGELIHPVHLHNAMQLAQQQQQHANANNGEGQQQRIAQNIMAHLPLERNDGPRPSSNSSSKIAIPAETIGRPLTQPPPPPSLSPTQAASA